MKAALPVYLYIFCFVFLVTTIQGKIENNISCYTCDSFHNPECRYPIDPSKVKMENCTEYKFDSYRNDACTKIEEIVTMGKYAYKGVHHTLKLGCGYIPNVQYANQNYSTNQNGSHCLGKIVHLPGNMTKLQKICTCQSDGCNVASRPIHCKLSLVGQIGHYVAMMIASFWLIL